MHIAETRELKAMYETQCQIISVVRAQSLQEQMFLLTILLTP